MSNPTWSRRLTSRAIYVTTMNEFPLELNCPICWTTISLVGIMDEYNCDNCGATVDVTPSKWTVVIRAKD